MNVVQVQMTVTSSRQMYQMGISEAGAAADPGISAEFSIHPAQKYRGAYTVTPRAYNEVILDTNGKVMGDNVTVYRVPYFETSNPDGETVYIAAEV